MNEMEEKFEEQLRQALRESEASAQEMRDIEDRCVQLLRLPLYFLFYMHDSIKNRNALLVINMKYDLKFVDFIPPLIRLRACNQLVCLSVQYTFLNRFLSFYRRECSDIMCISSKQ